MSFLSIATCFIILKGIKKFSGLKDKIVFQFKSRPGCDFNLFKPSCDIKKGSNFNLLKKIFTSKRFKVLFCSDCTQ